MAKFGSFCYSKIDIFTWTIRKGQLCFEWYLEASKTRNDRVTSLQKTLPGCRSNWTGKSRLAFMPFGFWFLGITLPSFGGTLVTWLLISGHVFAFCFIWSVTPGWWSSGLVWFVGLVWVHRHLVQTVRANMWIKVPHPTWEPLGKIFLND